MKARVLFSNVGWIGEDERRHSAAQGDVVDLPDAEFKRLSELLAVEKFAGGGKKATSPEEAAEAEAALQAEKAQEAGLPASPNPEQVRKGAGNR